jgi:hypothetical protein
MLYLALLIPLLALADAPLPPTRPMIMPESKPLEPKAVVIGQMPDCAALALAPATPDQLKGRLKQASTRGKAWQRLYTQTWGDYGEFDNRCRAYVSAANRHTQGNESIAELGKSETGLQLHLGQLRVEAASLSPPAKPAAVKPKPGSYGLLKREVSALQETFAKAKDSNHVDTASKCAGALGQQAAAIISALDRFEGRVKTLCVLPAANGESESNTGSN